MFKYAKDISLLAQDIIKKYVGEFNVAVDCTLGNGHDTDFLSENFDRVYAFDIQKEAIENYKNKNVKNVCLINTSHENLKENIKEKEIDCFMYNLGFLPGGNKDITTLPESSFNSLKEAITLLKSGGIITLCLYIGHEQGKKEQQVLVPYLESLDKSSYAVVMHDFINRSDFAPKLLVIEKK